MVVIASWHSVIQVEPSFSNEAAHPLAMKGNTSLSGPANRGQPSFSKDFSDIDRGIKIDISQEKASQAGHAAMRNANSTSGIAPRGGVAPDLASLAAQHAQGSGSTARGLQTAFNEGIMGAAKSSECVRLHSVHG